MQFQVDVELEYQIEIQKNQSKVSVQKLMTVSNWQGLVETLTKKRRAKVRMSDNKIRVRNIWELTEILYV